MVTAVESGSGVTYTKHLHFLEPELHRTLSLTNRAIPWALPMTTN